MPLKQQEIAHSHTTAKYLEEGVLAGVGVLLVFLGVFSKVPLTNILAVGIGAFVLYTAVLLFRSQNKKTQKEERVSEEMNGGESEQVSSSGYYGGLEKQGIDDQRIQSQAYQSKKNAPSIVVEEKAKYTMSNIEPQSEFNNLLIKVLSAINDVCFAHTVAFFWVNHETKQLVVEAKVTNSSSFLPDRKIALGNDIVSRIGAKGKPEIVNNILSETEKDILCYYTSLQDVKSFIGVPVYFANDMSSTSPIGVIAIDSKAEDAYGDETFAILSNFSKLISSLLISYTEKYELFADLKLVEADAQLKKRLVDKPSISSIVNGLAEELGNVIAWDSLCIVLFDQSQGGWSLASVRIRGNERFVAPKQLVEIETSIVGKALRTNSVQQINLATNTQMVFNLHEVSSELLKHGTLLVVPFSSNGKCFGAVAVTNRKSELLTKKDISAIQFLSSTAAAALEIAELNAIITEHIAVDEQTGVFSKKYFSQRLFEELQRANDMEEDLSMALVALSNCTEIEQRYGPEGKEAALMSIANQMRANVRSYDIVARFDATTFAAILSGTIANDAYLWAEKLRTKIAAGVVTIDKKSFSISVTIGISGASAKMLPEDIIKNTSLVLEQAKKAGGNIVRLF